MANKKLDVTMSFHDQFTSGFKNSINAMTNGSKAAQRTWKGVKKSGDAIANVGGKLTAGVTTPIVALGAASVKNFGDVDKQLKLVQQTMGSSNTEAKGLSEAIKAAASNSVYSMQDAADASLNFARQGFNAKETSDMIASAMNLAAGTGTDLSTVTSGLGNALKMFNIDSSEATKYADMLAKAQAQANTTTTDLFDAMSTAGPIVNTVGWSMKDLATMTDIFGNAGISGSEGATALKTGLAKLASPAKDGSAWMKKLGLNITNADGTMKSFADVQGQLHNSFSKLTQEQKLQAASAMFGKNQMGKWLTLIQASPKEVKKLSGALDGASGTSKSMSDALLNGVGGSIEKLKSTFDVFKYNIGEVAGDAIKGFIDKITGLLEKFNSLDDGQKKQILKWAAMAASVGPVLTVFGKGISVIGSMGQKFNVLKGIIQGVTSIKGTGGIFSKLLGGSGALGGGASKLTGLMSKIPGIGKVFGGLSTKLAAPTKGFKLLRVAIAGITSPLGIVIIAIGLAVAAFIAIKTHMDAFKKGLSASKPAFNEIKKSFQGLKKEMAPVMPVIKKVGQIFWEVFSGVIISAITGAVAVVANAINVIIKVITNVAKIIKNVVKLVKAIFTGDWKSAFDAGKGIVDGFVGAVKAVIGGVVDTVKSVGKAIKGVFSKIKIPHFSSGGVIPHKAVGDSNWGGGLVQVHERGGEIMDLPGGTRIYPHDESIAMARKEASRSLTIAKIADSIIVREEADIDKIVDKLVRKVELAEANAMA